jgi:hypothetical protein
VRKIEAFVTTIDHRPVRLADSAALSRLVARRAEQLPLFA